MINSSDAVAKFVNNKPTQFADNSIWIQEPRQM